MFQPLLIEIDINGEINSVWCYNFIRLSILINEIIVFGCFSRIDLSLHIFFNIPDYVALASCYITALHLDRSASIVIFQIKILQNMETEQFTCLTAYRQLQDDIPSVLTGVDFLVINISVENVALTNYLFL